MAARVALLFLAFALLLTSQSKVPPGMMQPRYTEGNRLIRPQGYREWMFIASNLGMGYNEEKAGGPGSFHNIYMQPEAYRQFRDTGTFPDKTMLVMEVVSPGTNASINKHGYFEDHFVGIEVALKDESHFPDKWAYFDLIGSETAAAFPKESCWNCHHEHGAVDNVFVQFYPVLREARAQH
jgi:Cytochrome P460